MSLVFVEALLKLSFDLAQSNPTDPLPLDCNTVFFYSASMISNRLTVTILPLRQRGWALPKYRWATDHQYRGRLSIREERSEDLRRHTLVARLHDCETAKLVDELPPLIDVRLLETTHEEMVITGTERVVELERPFDYVQTWLVIFKETTPEGSS